MTTKTMMLQTDPVMTLKSGSGSGDYSTSSTSYTDVDGTNLAYTVTIPSGYKLAISSSGSVYINTGIADISVCLDDGGTKRECLLTPPNFGGYSSDFCLNHIITGDGNSHTIKMRFKTSNALDSAVIRNSSSTIAPVMTFILMPSS